MGFFKGLLGGSANAIGADEAKERLSEFLVLDVRQPEEFRSGHIQGATLIPLGELIARMAELPKDKPILCVCQSGSRSSVATQQLTKAGYHATNMRGGMLGWMMHQFPIQRGR